MRVSSRTPNDYLDAALRIIAGEGAPKLTLAEVAREAGVSKGGLLHHYPNKETLLKGLLEREFAGFKDAVEKSVAASGTAPGVRTRAIIETSFMPGASGQNLLLSLLSVVFETPELLAAFRAEWAAYRQSFMGDGLPEAQVLLIQFALDGLFFADLLGLEPPSGKLRDDLRQSLLALTEGVQS